MEHLSDAVLLERFVRGGEQPAFAALTRRYASLVYATCLRRLGRVEAAEDASQAVYLLLAQNAARLRVSRSLAPWLYTMANLVCKGALRKESKSRLMEHELRTEYMQTVQTDAILSIVLDEAVGKLSSQDRDLVVLHFLQGLTLAELAETIGVTPDGARMRVRRALNKLRKRLAGLGVFIPVDELSHHLDASRVAPSTTFLNARLLSAEYGIEPRIHDLATGALYPMKMKPLKLGLSATGVFTILVVGANGLGALVRRAPQGVTTPYHVVSYAVQPGGADRDPKFVLHRDRDETISLHSQRITIYPTWKPGPVQADYLLTERGGTTWVTIRTTQGRLITMTREQAIKGGPGGQYAQATDLIPTESDFTKIEKFWKRAVVNIYPPRKIDVGGKVVLASPHEVTENGNFRMTGYVDANGRLLKRETYTKDAKGWYLTDFAIFDYARIPASALNPNNLKATPIFTLATPG